jgi:predicted acylesterase/phospholipase RssA
MPNAESFCRILSLDGGGAKGFYTLGVLREIEAMVDCPNVYIPLVWNGAVETSR